jgi:hypothetical protein
MFAYNPQVTDRSGEIMAAGQMQAAATNAQMMSDLGQNIGGALQSIGGTIGGAMQSNAQADSAFEAISAIGQMYPGMKKISSALEGMDPRTRRLASISILDNLGAISQLGIAGMNTQTRRDQQALTARGQQITLNMPAERAQQNAAAQVAAGQGRVTTLPANINPDVIP